MESVFLGLWLVSFIGWLVSYFYDKRGLMFVFLALEFIFLGLRMWAGKRRAA